MSRHHLLGLYFLFSATFCLAQSSDNPAFRSSSSIAFIKNKGQIIDQNNKPNPGVLYLLNTVGMNDFNPSVSVYPCLPAGRRQTG